MKKERSGRVASLASARTGVRFGDRLRGCRVLSLRKGETVSSRRPRRRDKTGSGAFDAARLLWESADGEPAVARRAAQKNT